MRLYADINLIVLDLRQLPTREEAKLVAAPANPVAEERESPGGKGEEVTERKEPEVPGENVVPDEAATVNNGNGRADPIEEEGRRQTGDGKAGDDEGHDGRGKRLGETSGKVAAWPRGTHGPGPAELPGEDRSEAFPVHDTLHKVAG